MELWDLYSANKQKLDRQVCRGEKLADDEYHLVANAWIVNDKGEFLITQRSSNKSHPNMWECTGGSCLAGETSLDGAIREAKEELNLTLSKDDAKFVGSILRYYSGCPDILEVWIFKSNARLEDVSVQKEEVQNVMWATKEQIYNLLKEHKFEANAFMLEAINGQYK